MGTPPSPRLRPRKSYGAAHGSVLGPTISEEEQVPLALPTPSKSSHTPPSSPCQGSSRGFTRSRAPAPSAALTRAPSPPLMTKTGIVTEAPHCTM